MAKTLDQVVSKWSANASGAQQAFVDGVRNTTVDPTQLAIANAAGAKAGYNAAIDSGLWARSLAAVGKAGWQAATEAKATNFGTGIAAGVDKYQRKMQFWLPVIQQVGAAARALPGATLQQRQARATYVSTQLYNRKRGL